MQKFINDLVMIGLTENEAKAYFLLLEQPSGMLPAIARMSTGASRSTRLKTIPVSGEAGLKTVRTFFPVWRPIPS